MRDRCMIYCCKMRMRCAMRKLVMHPKKTALLRPKGHRGIITSSLAYSKPTPNLPEMNDSEMKSASSLIPPETDKSTTVSRVECHPKLQEILSRACQHTYETNCLSDEDKDCRTEFRENMLRHLREQCHPKIELELFGSSSNGFGVPTSDIDLCISFKGHTTGENVSTSVLKGVRSALRKFDKCSNVRLINNAQVPIVTFDVIGEKFRCGDISLYNKLALRNSHLLYTYARMDNRCQILGLSLKHLMKTCGLAEQVSSYAFVVMVIHFLQQCVPPVLPVLQELHPFGHQKNYTVGGWDTWFFDDMSNIESVWIGYGLNNASIGELWFKLLQYYSDYNFEKHIISIRQHKKLSLDKKIHSLNKIAKEYHHERTRRLRWNHWVNRTILVEDPFDQVHNLMGSVSAPSAEMLIDTINKSYRELLKINNSDACISLSNVTMFALVSSLSDTV